ncbi:MAG: 3-methylornithine--L-lysine ligase PylC, partial [Anaerovoracaceae bacterium]
IDKNPEAPAAKICSRFVCGDVLGGEPRIIEELKLADMVLPTLENDEVLEGLEKLAEEHGFIYAFDLAAYKISSSKFMSDRLFHDHQIPSPRYYPEGEAPYIAKPDNESGSHGVTYFETEAALKQYLLYHKGSYIVQEYLEGPSYSIEVIGKPGNYRTYEVTKIHMDEGYDCKMVTSPCDITKEQAEAFEQMAKKLAEILALHGIMDLEVIDHKGEFKLLEIDARVPSQTPTAVYHTSGMNLIQELYDLFCFGEFKQEYQEEKSYAAFEHYLLVEGNLHGEGEHIMTQGGVLRYLEGAYGAEEVITDDEEGRKESRFTLINKAKTEEELNKKREEVKACLNNLR